MANKHILLVEDESHIAKGILFNLTRENYTVVHVENAKDALEQLRQQHFDLVILDRMLPDSSDGLDVCTQIRALDQQLPILMLTAMGREQDKVDGLSSGADDYLTKPFDVDELLARVRALIRRSEGLSHPDIVIRDIRIDTVRRRVSTGEGEIQLTPMEYSLLEYLAIRKGSVVSRTTLYERLFDESDDSCSNLLDVHVSNIRRKLGADVITTRRGHGYCVEVE